jgi:hypothetical protein
MASAMWDVQGFRDISQGHLAPGLGIGSEVGLNDRFRRPSEEPSSR